MTTWQKEIADAKGAVSDVSLFVAMTLTLEEYTREFSNGFGGAEGVPFTYWTEDRVYFPVVYDGSEWVGSAPRNPCDEATKHQGGE